MGRPLWSGTIAFGLVQVPVTLHGAEEHDALSFAQLDSRDFSPIGYERINKRTGKKVAWADIVRGYEYAKGRYVVLSDEELAHANVEASHTIDLLAFVKTSDIDPMYIERPLWVLPSKSGRRAYGLLVETLADTGRSGIGQVVLRTRQHLAALVPRDGRLVLLVLRYAHDLTPPKGLDLPAPSKKGSTTAAERRMAEQLVQGLAAPWEPERYEDTYFGDVMALVKKKVASGAPTATLASPAKPPPARAGAKVIDLATLLEKSLARTSKDKSAPRTHARPHRKSA
jgi:DNA end-binding protein Ku